MTDLGTDAFPRPVLGLPRIALPHRHEPAHDLVAHLTEKHGFDAGALLDLDANPGAARLTLVALHFRQHPVGQV